MGVGGRGMTGKRGISVVGDDDSAAPAIARSPLCMTLVGVGVLVTRSEESDHSLV